MVYLARLTAVFLAASFLAIPAFANRSHNAAASGGHTANAKKSTAKSARTRGKASAKPASRKLHGQQVIASERVTEIQQALIREHYLSGDANGQWDSMTQAAMLKFQQDNGWQTRLLPDSRALKKLGLGPDYSKAINADASLAVPTAEGAPQSDQGAGFAAASGVNQ